MKPQIKRFLNAIRRCIRNPPRSRKSQQNQENQENQQNQYNESAYIRRRRNAIYQPNTSKRNKNKN